MMKPIEKKWKLFLFTFVSLLVLTLAACGSSDKSSTESGKSDGKASDDDVIELVVNSWFSSDADVPNNVWKPWEKYVEEKTEGRVKVTVHYNGALAASNEVLEGVKSGLFDVGDTIALYYEDSQLFPLTIGELPFAAGGDPDKAAEIMKEFSAEYLDEIWDGVVKVGVGSPPPNYAFSTKPIDNLNYMKGKTARASTELEALLVESMGGAPTQVSFEELYNSLDKGMIETFFTTKDVFAAMQLADVAPNYLDQPVKIAVGTALMNEDFFNSLPKDLQTLFAEDINPKWEELYKENARKVMERNDEVAKMAKESGGTVTKFSEKELLELQQYAVPVWEQWVKNANEKGYPGDEMLKRYIEISKKHGVELEFLK
ncbi:TRAP transporter substrate-binding protein DctP [Neobacillus niacini]|uniref:TRAP transporter substrate-binding protein DctP n=1 Tax=Neobacillus niacini TaxID=86668 RepID=UPI0009EE3716|nr:TRAP transporter substrate-binding protein DctP [Neobacillus niacini]MEC1520779.1 TRAP transporter substrate-binding protein DctP [Neobacillus niacini]